MLEGGDQFQNEFLFVIFIVRAMVETAFKKGPFKTFTTASHHEILMKYQQCSLSIYALHKNDSEICEIWVSIALKSPSPVKWPIRARVIFAVHMSHIFSMENQIIARIESSK